MDSPRIPKRGRKPQASFYKCSVCEYISARQYNVFRHEVRIHTASAKLRECCGISLMTKGDYYVHCEEFHPYSRGANVISRSKYKILGENELSKPREDTKIQNSNMPEKFIRAPYMLRNRARANTNLMDEKVYAETTNSELSSESESDSGDPSYEDDNEDQKTSGYGTKSSSLKINDNELRSSISMTESSDAARETSVKTNIDIDESPSDVPAALTTDRVLMKNESEISPEQPEHPKYRTPYFSSFSENTDTTIYPISPASETKNLPIKKRILKNIATNNRDNIMRSKASIVDRLYCRVKSERRISIKKRKQRRLTRRMRRRENIKSENSSSDIENISPLSTKINVNIDSRIVWHGVKEWLGSIDFESFKKYQ